MKFAKSATQTGKAVKGSVLMALSIIFVLLLAMVVTMLVVATISVG